MTDGEPALYPCQECGEEGSYYSIDDTEFLYCPQHAADAGFCTFCGGFYGGTEEFFISGIDGICCECLAEIDHESNNDDFYDSEEYEEAD